MRPETAFFILVSISNGCTFCPGATDPKKFVRVAFSVQPTFWVHQFRTFNWHSGTHRGHSEIFIQRPCLIFKLKSAKHYTSGNYTSHLVWWMTSHAGHMPVLNFWFRAVMFMVIWKAVCMLFCSAHILLTQKCSEYSHNYFKPNNYPCKNDFTC